jgi:voltage-gated sodium channel
METLRKKAQKITTSKFFEVLVIVVIVLNSIVLGAETYSYVRDTYGHILFWVDMAFLTFFVLEIVLRIFVERVRFFVSGWNWFDFLIVLASLLPVFGNLSALRALRILRALRLLTAVPVFRRVLSGISLAIKNSAPVAVVLAVIMYVYGVMSSKLFGDTDPTHFADLDSTLLTLFQIMTLDSWNAIVRPLIEVHWWAGVYFVSFVIIGVFVLLSIVIGIASEAMGSTSDRASNQDILDEIKKLESDRSDKPCRCD